MANPPRLNVSGLPNISAEDAAATASPARGAEMLSFLKTRLNTNRAPPLVHSWEFWHDRSPSSASTGDASGYEARLEQLASIDDVRQFWNVFNNFEISRLQLRDSIHLFHKGVKPVWEDPRNARGGSWTFRVPKAQAAQFWNEVALFAIGEQLQQAVEDPQRKTFRDDICGISLGVRFNSMLVQVWNRDGEHEAGYNRVRDTILEGLSQELRPKEGSYYYKKHNEHAAFSARAVDNTATSADSQPRISSLGTEMQSLDGVVRGDNP